MNIMEQLMDDMGYEKYVETLINLGVTEMDMTTFSLIIADEYGNKEYCDWLEENSLKIAETFEAEYRQILADQRTNLLLVSVCIVNEFMKWTDSKVLN